MLFISNLFPNSAEPYVAPFNRRQIIALSSYFAIDVIAPIPWPKRIGKYDIPFEEYLDGVRVFHPTYYYIPKILRGFHGNFYHRSIVPIADNLIKKNCYDVIYSSWLYPDGWATAKIARKYRIPLFIKVHGTDVNQLKGRGRITKRSISTAFEARKIICVSNALKERLLSLGVPNEISEVLYNGVDKNIFFPRDRNIMRRELDIPIDTIIVLFVGNIKQSKGMFELVNAFNAMLRSGKISPLRLVIIGEGKYRETLESIINSFDNMSQHVSFLGSLSSTSVAKWMCVANVLCLPSYMEGLPNVIVEALSCNTRVVATSVGGIPELASKNRLISLVPPKEIDALSEALEIAISTSVNNQCSFSVMSWEENARILSEMILREIA